MSGMDAKLTDAWANGEAYEKYVGRWSRLIARDFLEWLDVPVARDWLDVGCGTGTLVEAILESQSPRSVEGIDLSEGFLARARAMIQDARVRFDVAGAESLPADAASFDAVVSGLVLNFVSAPERAAAEMFRVTRPGGVVGVYVWDYAGKMEFMSHFWDAAIALDAGAAKFNEGSRFPLCQPEPLEGLFSAAGFEGLVVRGVEIPTIFKDFDDYWTPFLGGQGPAPTYAMSLNEERRAALRERIRARLPIAVDGTIPLVARAWALRCVRPESR